jgi:hypothetical protein
MANETYQAAYEASANELESLLEEKERIEKRVLSLRKTINALAILISEQGGKEATFLDYARARMRQLIDTTLTGDIHRIVLMADGPLTAGEIREEIKKLGGSLAEHSNPLATIHAIANRLVESRKVNEVTKDGKKAWEKATVPVQKLGTHKLTGKK